ncbi:MAG: DnaD domain protein [Clostridium neonatale]
MARPKKQKVDYFPHFVSSGRTIFILENTYGNDGYAFWFKLLEILGDSEGHYYDCNNTANWQFLVAKTHVDEVSAEKIIKTLIELGQIDEELWQNKIIWVQNFVDNLTELYRKRSTKLPSKPSLNGETKDNDSFRGENSTSAGDNSVKTPQRKEKESIEKDSKEKNNIFYVFENCGFGSIDGYTMQQLEGLVKDFTFEWTKEAIEIAAENGARNLKYVTKILENWKSKGKDYKPNKNNSNEPKPLRFNNFEPQEYDYDKLEKKLLGWDDD